MNCAPKKHNGKYNLPAGPQARESQKLAVSIRAIEFSIWQAEFIGWPELADSFRKDLEQAKATGRVVGPRTHESKVQRMVWEKRKKEAASPVNNQDNYNWSEP